MTVGAAEPFDPDTVAAVARHMNDDHAADCLVICQALGGRPDAVAAHMVGMDASGLAFAVEVPGGEAEVRVPWSTVPSTRADVRVEVVRLYEEAQAATPGDGTAPAG